MSTTTVLPDKLSDLLELAISDAQALDPRVYRLRMSTWHTGTRCGFGGVCNVCLAGAVMARRLGMEPQKLAVPGDFGDLRYKLLAINRLRCGSVTGALEVLGIGYPPQGITLELAAAARGAELVSDTPWVAGWRAHTALVRELRAAGL